LQIARRAHGESNAHTAKLLAYTDKLLAAFSGSGARAGNERATKGQSEIYNLQSAMVEPLSERELEVLRLIAAGRSNHEIAHDLIIAVGTAKRHVHSIFGKLGVSNRLEAVIRARELGLLIP